MNIERKEELVEIGEKIGCNEELLNAPALSKSDMSRSMSRIALGLDPRVDIADLCRNDQLELLLIMRTVRNTIYG